MAFPLLAPSLVLLTILNMKFDESFCMIGLVCSSFVAINAATHERHPWSPLGNTSRPHVQLGNVLASRKLGSSVSAGALDDVVQVITLRQLTFIGDLEINPLRPLPHFGLLRVALLVLALQACGAGWFIEQPSSSLAWFHPRVRSLLRQIPAVPSRTVVRSTNKINTLR